MRTQVTGNIVNIFEQTTRLGTITIEDGIITAIELSGEPDPALPYLLPGFVDAHVHIESSLLVPSEFARMAVVHGTVATVSDPHEIANVCGMAGVEYMIENGSTVPFHFNFGAPSCVPATTFETAGAVVDAQDVASLMARPEIKYLSEVMNFPGVLAGDADMLAKMAAAKEHGKPIDGHAPGLRGEDARRYIAAGPSTDHECFTEAEAREKLEYGMKVLIREGSAARNFEALIPLLYDYPNDIMFCSDDKHPDSLLAGHINQLCARAIAKGIPLFNVLQAACINPVLHYGLEVGLLRKGDAADLIVVRNLEDFEVLQTYIRGKLVAENGVSLIARTAGVTTINNFKCTPKTPEQFRITKDAAWYDSATNTIAVIEALEGQLITNKLKLPATLEGDTLLPDVANDILKILVVNRYQDAPVAVAFIRNFGLKRGALASSVAHDSHNIVAVGVDDASICAVVNAVIEKEGGLAVANATGVQALGLPVAGLMSNDDAYVVAEKYIALDAAAKALDTPLAAPFMTLSFMALLVIPHLKLSDKGLFDGNGFRLM
ncbi:Adenine deaminase [Cnuella takakiae]|uniref:Adenine deaminase n=1 Tax=Cnuella takakiae TaxID=1302690 RepID=A0A1M4XC66_9BACT|nr:adenine deaminase [Cnuella takakiae]OLY91471.1 adenine deaminase [Cnuella takakiae]SHE90965.1 Adenine deaminase [Cnuella takakiae]